MGITLGTAILQNELKRRLPKEFLEEFGNGVEGAYGLVEVVRTLDEPMRGEVQGAYAEGTRGVWLVMVVVAALGGLCVLATKEIKPVDSDGRGVGSGGGQGGRAKKD